MSQSSDMFNDGQAYEKQMGRWSRLAGEQFIKWIDVPVDKTWLDVGCGTGAFTEEILARCQPKLVEGLDPSPAQIEFAKARPSLGAAKLQVGDALSLPYVANSFDVGVMALVIAFIPDAAKAVAELARVVRPGAAVATYMWEFPDGVPMTPILHAFAKFGRPAPLPPNTAASKASALETLWKNAGLRDVETTTFYVPVSFKDFDDFWQTVTLPANPLSKMIQSLPAEFKTALQVEIRARLPASADGSIVYDCFANAVKGRKG